MKEELIRVLNSKLDSINSDIDALKELNKKEEEENEKLDFVNGIINVFDENGEKNPLNFDKIDKEDFGRAIDIAGDEVKRLFDSGACNYDGLVYLISGIKSGVSITLTNEQLNGIEFFIQTLTERKEALVKTIGEFDQEKSKYEISDVNELKTKKDKYSDVIKGIDNGEYIKDIDILKEAIAFAKITPEETINILSYILEFNADLYKGGNKPVEEEAKEEVKEETKETEKETEEVKEEEVEEDNGFKFNQIENDNPFDLPNITFDDGLGDNPVDNEVNNDIVMPELPQEDDTIPPVEVETKEENDYQEFTPVAEPVVETEEVAPIETEVEPTIETPKVSEEPQVEVPPVESEVTVDAPVNEEESIELPEVEPVTEDVVTPYIAPLAEEPIAEVTPIEPVTVEPIAPVTETVQEPEIDSDFKDVVTSKNDYEEEIEVEKEDKTTSTRELHKVFSKYGIEENVVLNELIDGDVTEYQKTLDFLRDKNVLDLIKKNKELLIEILLYSDTEVIDKVLRIIKEDLSVDDEDYEITKKIAVNTIPSIFIREGGNYDNFIKNVELFKNLELNLINLFDFSKEIFVADHEDIEENLATINKYDFDINYKNAKYLLLIPHIEDKLDYYIESVYDDKTKGEKFDGINYIKEYAPKLNVVTDETIKRLRYASVNGKKVFGNKPGSLTGEITNLKVNALDLNDEYLNSFFNNGFTDITPDEVREYVKLAHNSSNVGDYSDELDKLNSYHVGLRYVFDGINVSYNKVLRNYSILRSYGIEAKKALHFAVCYNLVITKDEYNKLINLLDSIGGNQ